MALSKIRSIKAKDATGKPFTIEWYASGKIDHDLDGTPFVVNGPEEYRTPTGGKVNRLSKGVYSVITPGGDVTVRAIEPDAP